MSGVDDWLDSKRLIGPHGFGDAPGALLEVAGEGAAFEARIDRWRHHVADLLALLGWSAGRPPAGPSGDIAVHPHAGGSMLTLRAPVDVLYTATEVAEAAWVAAADPAGHVSDETLERLRAERDGEADPAALRLYREARRRDLPALLDDSGLLLGLGHHGRHWPPGEAPAPEAVPWDALGTVPVALVTGTNGKTTTTRLLATMGSAAGHVTGLASTDGARIGSEIVDDGDVAGPGGARRVLREPTLTLAVLETARGGLLRRGLALDCAQVAVVTNISADHLGDGGVDSLERLAEVKFLVLRGLAAGGSAILNADDARCRERGLAHDGTVVWFSLTGPFGDGACAYLAGERLRFRDAAGTETALARVDELPMALAGQARHNVANALAALAAARALALPFEAIDEALRSFGTSPSDNAGRGTLLEGAGVRVLIDFGHNPAGVAAVLGMFPADQRGRLHVVLGQAGDRSDEAIRDLTRAAHGAGADRFVIKEMGEYRRGRPAGQIPGLIREELLALGTADALIDYRESEPEAARAALAGAEPGDVVVLFVHAEADAVRQVVKEVLGASPAAARRELDRGR